MADDARLASRTVDWWAVHTFVVPVLDRVGTWPMAGTLAWSALGDNDPAKIAALFDAARRDALRWDTRQQQLAQASRDVSAAMDCRGIARNMLSRNGIYIPRKRADVA
jgi:Protein of unknown function (DUF2742)